MELTTKAAFMLGFRKCFVTGEVVDFDPLRCAVAAEYLALYASQLPNKIYVIGFILRVLLLQF